MAAKASTCVAGALNFTPPGVRRQTTARAIGELVEPPAYPTWQAANRNWLPTFGPLRWKPAVGCYRLKLGGKGEIALDT